MSPEANMSGDAPRATLLERRSARRLHDLYDVVVVERPSNEAAGRVGHVDGRVRVAVVPGEQLIEALGVPAAPQSVRRCRYAFARGIGRGTAVHQRGFTILDGNGEAAGMPVPDRAIDAVCTNRKKRARGRCA